MIRAPEPGPKDLASVVGITDNGKRFHRIVAKGHYFGKPNQDVWYRTACGLQSVYQHISVCMRPEAQHETEYKPCRQCYPYG